jgi:uncharacterized protein
VENDDRIKELLLKSRVVAVVGLSPDQHKPSNEVARYLQRKGYRIIPVNPTQDMILGEKAYKSLVDIQEEIDIVDIFRKPDEVIPLVREALQIRPRAIWLQLGVRNDEAKELVEKSGIPFIMDRCVKQEHSRLLGSH